MAIIGIDLGTSNSAAAVLRGGRPVIIPSQEGVTLGGKAFPSYVAVGADGQMLIGEPARRQATANPEGTATAFKRGHANGRDDTRVPGRRKRAARLQAYAWCADVKRSAAGFTVGA